MDTHNKAKRLIKKLGRQLGSGQVVDNHSKAFKELVGCIPNKEIRSHIKDNYSKYKKLFIRYIPNKEVTKTSKGKKGEHAAVNGKENSSHANHEGNKKKGNTKLSTQDEQQSELVKKRKLKPSKSVQPSYTYNLFRSEKHNRLDSLPAKGSLYGHLFPTLSSESEWDQLWNRFLEIKSKDKNIGKIEKFHQLSRFISGETNPSLFQWFMDTFLQETSEESLQAADVHRFLVYFCMKKTLVDASSCPRYHDLMAAILSLYIDLLVKESRKSEEAVMIGKNLTRFSFYLFSDRPKLVVDALLQADVPDHRDAKLMRAIFRKAFATQRKQDLTCTDYSKAVCFHDKAESIFKGEKCAEEFRKMFLSLTVPESFQQWLTDHGIDYAYSVEKEYPDSFPTQLMEVLTEQTADEVEMDKEKTNEGDGLATTENSCIETDQLFFIDAAPDVATSEMVKDIFADLEDTNDSPDEDMDASEADDTSCGKIVADTLKSIRNITEKEQSKGNVQIRSKSEDFFGDSDLEVLEHEVVDDSAAHEVFKMRVKHSKVLKKGAVTGSGAQTGVKAKLVNGSSEKEVCSKKVGKNVIGAAAVPREEEVTGAGVEMGNQELPVSPVKSKKGTTKDSGAICEKVKSPSPKKQKSSEKSGLVSESPVTTAKKRKSVAGKMNVLPPVQDAALESGTLTRQSPSKQKLALVEDSSLPDKNVLESEPKITSPRSKEVVRKDVPPLEKDVLVESGAQANFQILKKQKSGIGLKDVILPVLETDVPHDSQQPITSPNLKKQTPEIAKKNVTSPIKDAALESSSPITSPSSKKRKSAATEKPVTPHSRGTLPENESLVITPTLPENESLVITPTLPENESLVITPTSNTKRSAAVAKDVAPKIKNVSEEFEVPLHFPSPKKQKSGMESPITSPSRRKQKAAMLVEDVSSPTEGAAVESKSPTKSPSLEKRKSVAAETDLMDVIEDVTVESESPIDSPISKKKRKSFTLEQYVTPPKMDAALENISTITSPSLKKQKPATVGKDVTPPIEDAPLGGGVPITSPRKRKSAGGEKAITPCAKDALVSGSLTKSPILMKEKRTTVTENVTPPRKEAEMSLSPKKPMLEKISKTSKTPNKKEDPLEKEIGLQKSPKDSNMNSTKRKSKSPSVREADGINESASTTVEVKDSKDADVKQLSSPLKKSERKLAQTRLEELKSSASPRLRTRSESSSPKVQKKPNIIPSYLVRASPRTRARSETIMSVTPSKHTTPPHSPMKEVNIENDCEISKNKLKLCFPNDNVVIEEVEGPQASIMEFSNDEEQLLDVAETRSKAISSSVSSSEYDFHSSNSDDDALNRSGFSRTSRRKSTVSKSKKKSQQEKGVHSPSTSRTPRTSGERSGTPSRRSKSSTPLVGMVPSPTTRKADVICSPTTKKDARTKKSKSPCSQCPDTKSSPKKSQSPHPQAQRKEVSTADVILDMESDGNLTSIKKKDVGLAMPGMPSVASRAVQKSPLKGSPKTSRRNRIASKEVDALRQSALTDFFVPSPSSLEKEGRKYSLRHKPLNDEPLSSIFTKEGTPNSTSGGSDIFDGPPRAAATYSAKRRRRSEMPKSNSDLAEVTTPVKRRLSTVGTPTRRSSRR